MDISILKKLGLSDKEIVVYLKLLEYNGNSVRNLAELSGINRGTTYDVLKSLQKKGLVSYFHQGSKQRFVAEDPEKLSHLIKIQEDGIKNAKSKITDLIPELKSLQDKGDEKPAMKYYESKSGVRSILEDVLDSLESNEEYYVYSAKEASEDWKKAYPNFTKDRIKKKIKVKSISLAKGGGTHGLDKRKWIGADDKSATFIMMYKNKCAFISRDANNIPVGVIIENKMMYETQKMIFMKLWSLLK